MGSDNSKDQIQKINYGEWMNIKTEDGTEIVKSNKGNVEAEIRLIGLDPKHDIEKQKSIYSYRKNTKLPLVKALGAQFSKSESKTLCGNQQNVKVLTQRIPYRLQNIRNLNYPQSLYVLSESLAGFHDLYNKAGVFDITNKMIGFNTKGQTKVWLNQNFAENHPISQRPILQTTLTTPQNYRPGITSQQRMVENVIDQVEKKCENKQKFVELHKAMENKTKTFNQAYNSIEDYIRQRNINVPDHIDFKNQYQYQEKSSQLDINRNTIASHSLEGTQINSSVGVVGTNRNTVNIQQPYTAYTRSIPQPVYTTTTPRIITTTTIPQSPSRIYHSPNTPRVYTNPTTVSFNPTSYVRQPEPYTYGIISRPLSPKFSTTTATTRPISFNYQSPNPQVIKY